MMGETDWDKGCQAAADLVCMVDADECSALFPEGKNTEGYDDFKFFHLSCQADPCEVPDGLTLNESDLLMIKMMAACTEPCENKNVCQAVFESESDEDFDWNAHTAA